MNNITMSDFMSAALLAGGSSQRMGFDKQFFHIYKGRLFEHILPKLSSLFEDVMIVTGQPELYTNTNIRTVADEIPGFGPLSGIHAAVKKSISKYVYVLACDMPVINGCYIDYMIDLLNKHAADACVTRKGSRIEPFHAFYGKKSLPVIEADLLEGKASILYLLEKINTYYIPESEAQRFTPDWSLFSNLNTPEDLFSWESKTKPPLQHRP